MAMHNTTQATIKIVASKSIIGSEEMESLSAVAALLFEDSSEWYIHKVAIKNGVPDASTTKDACFGRGERAGAAGISWAIGNSVDFLVIRISSINQLRTILKHKICPSLPYKVVFVNEGIPFPI